MTATKIEVMDDPGKYGDVCKKVRLETEAEGVVMMIINGKLGSGFDVQVPGNIVEDLPIILEFMAKQIRADVAQAKKMHS